MTAKHISSYKLINNRTLKYRIRPNLCYRVSPNLNSYVFDHLPCSLFEGVLPFRPWWIILQLRAIKSHIRPFGHNGQLKNTIFGVKYLAMKMPKLVFKHQFWQTAILGRCKCQKKFIRSKILTFGILISAVGV